MNNEDFEDDKKDAGHTVTALYEIVPNKSRKNRRRLRYQSNELSEKGKSNELVTLKLRYKKPDGKKSRLLEQIVSTNTTEINRTSDNFRHSAAVAQFGMLLRKDKKCPDTSWQSAIEMATKAKGEDKEGYRSEMIQLIKTAALLAEGVAQD